MDIQIEHECSQCGGKKVLSEATRFFSCSYCGVGSFILPDRISRLFIPPVIPSSDESSHLLVPYLRFKGTVFTVSSRGIAHRVVDTTQTAATMPSEIPPSLGVRPQAMKLQRAASNHRFSYLPKTIKNKVIFDKVINISNLINEDELYHLSYIGENISLIYLPLVSDGNVVRDAVTDRLICDHSKMEEALSLGAADSFKSGWQLDYLPSICPHCGWSLEGEGDGVAFICQNCDRAWELTRDGMVKIKWQMVDGGIQAHCYLPFWLINEAIPELNIISFADFITCVNLPMIPKQEWHQRDMSFWVPAFKISPKSFLRAGKQATVNQWKIEPGKGKKLSGFYPATLPSSEGIQAVKAILAKTTASPKKVFPFLPRIKMKSRGATLVYLPFFDKGHDWLQPETGIVIGKNNLRFGRSM
ncbi:MAG: hypothetical protein GY702_25135 [Desulfobulbaceae bacterium]|nr:hypothetical protein [Desulfobulbaceae bacterium]